MAVIRRYERKYLIDASLVDDISASISAFCDLDPYHLNAQEGGYTIQSLYLDTPALDFYEDKKARRLSRAKPRVRFYGEQPGDRVWLEIKRKVNGVVIKTRSKLPTADWPGLLDAPADSLSPAEAAFAAFVVGRGAIPVVHVRYQRLAFVSAIDDYARVTFDTALCSAPAQGSPELVLPSSAFTPFDDPPGCTVPTSPVILELKCEANTPLWMIDLVRRFGLMETAFSKYCVGLDATQPPAPLFRLTR